MKKIAKISVGIALAAAFATTAGALAGCNNASGKNGTGEAYGVTHSSADVARFVGYAKVTYQNDKITDLVLTEVDCPSQIKATESVPEADRVAVAGTSSTSYYYKTVSYGSVTLTFDAALGDYKVGDTDFKTYLQSEANCKVYYEAAINNQIKVKIGDEQKGDIMTKAALSKEENGYWTTEDKDGQNYSRWKMNRDATVKYVKENGVDKLLSLTKSTTEVNDLKEDKKVKPWTDGTVITGATWSDLNPTPAPTTYVSYAQLIVNAANAVK